MNKSFLKWAGGKFDLVPTILNMMPGEPQMKRYIEPFVGGGSVVLNMPIGVHKIINDVNPGVVAVWRALQEDGEKFIEGVRRDFFGGEHNNSESYYTFRQRFNHPPDHWVEWIPDLFLYLNRHCFNGLCRFNSNGEFNVPFGRYKKVYFPEKELLHAVEVLKNTQIFQADFRSIMCGTKQGDVIFCDPPYVSLSETASFTAYSKGGFSFNDQIALADCAVEASKRGATVIITNHDTADTRALYKHADECKSVSVKRRISCKGDSRHSVNEIIAIYRP